MENQRDFCTECRRERATPCRKSKSTRLFGVKSILLRSQLFSATNAAAKWAKEAYCNNDIKVVSFRVR